MPNAFSMKVSSTNTDMLKFCRWASFSSPVFALMNFLTSGCHTCSVPICAPRLLPPCLMTSTFVSNSLMNDMGPLATPTDPLTTSPSGLSWEKS